MGLDREQVQQSKPLPTTQALLDWYFVLTRHRSMVEVVSGAQIGIESQPPTIFHQLAQPLKEHYGCTDEQIAFFPTHVEADTQHGGRAYDLVEKYARTPEQRARAVLAAREGAEKRWLYVDGIYIHYQLGYPLTDAPWHQYRAEYGPSPFYDAVY
jgi:pyrroloquinoline quinone (PQQ) biosynthesis protein C